MDWNKKILRKNIVAYGHIGLLLLFAGCSISYQFNGASVDYNLTKSISVQDFPNYADYVYPTLSQTFTQELRNRFINQTRLKMIDTNADLEIEGEITGYRTDDMAVRADALASETKLTISVKVRYRNNKKPDEDFEQTFSAYRSFDSSTKTLDSVQDELIRQIVEDLTDQIFNATLGNW